MYFLESYLTFLLQNRLSYPKADDSGETIVGQNEIIFKYSPTWDVYIKLLVLFFSVGFASKILYRTVFLDVFNKLDDTKRFELPSYCLSMFHHSYVTVLGFFQIHSLYSNFVRHIEPDSVIIKSMIEPVPVVVAYIVADIYFYAFPEFIRTKRWDFLLHHVASIAGLAGFLQSPVIPTYRLLPHAMICELSGLFMAVGWFMKLHGFRSTSMYKYTEIGFAVSFFLTRIINLPLTAYGILFEMAPVLQACAVPILSLQVFWFYKIVRSFVRGRNYNKEK